MAPLFYFVKAAKQFGGAAAILFGGAAAILLRQIILSIH